MYLLGQMYRQGKGVEINFKKSIKYYKKSCEKGNDSAIFYLAYMYKKGQKK